MFLVLFNFRGKNENKYKQKIILSLVLVLVMSAVVSCTKNEEMKNSIKDVQKTEEPISIDLEIIEAIDEAIKWKIKEDEIGEWEIISIQRDMMNIPVVEEDKKDTSSIQKNKIDIQKIHKDRMNILESYLDEFKKVVEENKGEFEDVNDYSRLLLTATALGLDGKDVLGYNFVEKIYSDGNLVGEFTSTAAYGLIALDSKGYSIPEGENWTRQEIVEWLLSIQNEDGGFGYEEGADSDVDMTAMVLQSLSNYQDKEDVKEATDKALNYISENQEEDGGFITWDEDTSETVSQTIIALTSLGIDPKEDERFIKEGNLVDKLVSFKEEDGGFLHTYGEGNESDGFATEQALRGLVAYNRFTQGRRHYYDMDDVE